MQLYRFTEFLLCKITALRQCTFFQILEEVKIDFTQKSKKKKVHTVFKKSIFIDVIFDQ